MQPARAILITAMVAAPLLASGQTLDDDAMAPEQGSSITDEPRGDAPAVGQSARDDDGRELGAPEQPPQPRDQAAPPAPGQPMPGPAAPEQQLGDERPASGEMPGTGSAEPPGTATPERPGEAGSPTADAPDQQPGSGLPGEAPTTDTATGQGAEPQGLRSGQDPFSPESRSQMPSERPAAQRQQTDQQAPQPGIGAGGMGQQSQNPATRAPEAAAPDEPGARAIPQH